MAEKTITERRIEVLLDALEQLRIGKYKATLRTYINATMHMKGVTSQCKIGQVANSLEERTQGEYCKVCADGALLLSSLRKGGTDDSMTTGDANDNTKILLDRNRLFSRQQYNLMEAYFENDQMHTTVATHKISRWNGESTPTERMIKIFENAIKNDGIFDPDKE